MAVGFLSASMILRLLEITEGQLSRVVLGKSGEVS